MGGRGVLEQLLCPSNLRSVVLNLTTTLGVRLSELPEGEDTKGQRLVDLPQVSQP